jgi:hypothetical protein
LVVAAIARVLHKSALIELDREHAIEIQRVRIDLQRQHELRRRAVQRIETVRQELANPITTSNDTHNRLIAGESL